MRNMSLRSFRAVLCVAAVFLTACSASAQFANRDHRYHLRPGDVISVTYRYSPEYNATVALQPDGYVGLPLLGELSLGGLTVLEAQDRLAAKAGERLNAPEIVVELKEFEKPYYIIGGQVGAPGKFDYRGPISALRAIQLAGGFKDSAKTSQVLLIRPVNDVDAETRLINLKRVVDQRQIREDLDLRPGDMLIVPRNWVSKIEPYIKLTNLGLYMNPAGF
jgi:polysaccharide export outer membrane protein